MLLGCRSVTYFSEKTARILYVCRTKGQNSSNGGELVKKPAALPMFGRIKTSAITKPLPKETPVCNL